jgi:hypothetical protein
MTNKEIVDELFTQPKKLQRKDYAKYSYIDPNYEIEIDLLTLPNDKGYEYALIATDVGSRMCDAEALKSKDAETVLQGLKKIFARGYVKKPKKQIDFDRGTEFKGATKKYMKENNLIAKKSVAYKKHHNPLVEGLNGVIGEFLFRKMAEQEVQNKKINKTWVKYLPLVVKAINATAKKREPKPIDNIDDEDPTQSTDPEKDLKLQFEIGDIVRVIKEAPSEIANGRKLFGKIRRADAKWSNDTYKITNILVYPQQPIRYQVNDGTDRIYYEKELLKSKFKGIDNPNNKKTKYVVEKLIDKRKEGRIIQYLVKWRKYDETTWEPRARLIEDGFNDEIKVFEKNKK